MLNLNELRVEKVSWQWSVARVTVPRLSTWFDVTWRDVIWRDVTWRDITWRGITWHDGQDVTWRDVTWHDVTWHDVTWRDITWHDMTWHDVAWRDMRYMTWHDVTWRMTWHDVHDVTWREHYVAWWHNVAWRDMTWHDVTWRGITWHDMTLRDMTIKLTIKRWSCDRPATFARLLINLELFCQGTNVWVTSKTSWTRRWPEFLRSPKHSSSVGMSSNDSLTSKTRMVKKFQKIYKTQSPVPPGTCWTGSQPGFSRSPKHCSSVEISAMDSLTSKTWIVKKFQKSIRHIHQYLRVRLEPEVYLDFRE